MKITLEHNDTKEQPTVLERLFGPHSDNLQRALGRTSQRQGLVSNNLANVNTPGFKRQDVDFGIVLEGAQNQSRLDQAKRRLGQSPETFRGIVRVDGSSVNVESEMTALAETELRYEMLSEMTRRYFSGLRDTIREGR